MNQPWWKTALIAAAVVAAVSLLVRPEWLQELLRVRDGKGGDEGYRESQLRGRIRQAAQFHSEVGSRLDAYKARFDCEAAAVLDEAFLDTTGVLAVHPLRKEWYELRRELSEFLETHEYYRQALAHAEAEIMGSPARVADYNTLPGRAMAWDRLLDQAITERVRKLPKYTELAKLIMSKRGGAR
jgi:hypothetical protein